MNFELIGQLGGGAVAIAFLIMLESSSIAKNLAAKSGRRLDLNQHMLSIGAANVASSVASGVAVSGSLTRSTLNYHSGAHTGVSSLICGGLIIVGIFLLGPLIGFIPRAAFCHGGCDCRGFLSLI